MRLSFLILFTTLISSTCLADAEMDFYMTLNGLEQSAPSEIALIKEQIVHIQNGEFRNPLSLRSTGPKDCVGRHSIATTNECWLINSHQDLYATYCYQNKLARNCSISGSSAAHRDLNAIQITMTLKELQDRLVYLEGVKKRVAAIRALQSVPRGLTGARLSWKAVPNESKDKFVVPTEFSMAMPANGTMGVAAPTELTDKRLPAGEKKPFTIPKIYQPDHSAGKGG